MSVRPLNGPGVDNVPPPLPLRPPRTLDEMFQRFVVVENRSLDVYQMVGNLAGEVASLKGMVESALNQTGEHRARLSSVPVFDDAVTSSEVDTKLKLALAERERDSWRVKAEKADKVSDKHGDRRWQIVIGVAIFVISSLLGFATRHYFGSATVTTPPSIGVH